MVKQNVAIMYDFDKTLCTKDMQEFTFIPKVRQTPEEFWKYSTDLANGKKMDHVLAYMYAMVKFAKKEDVKITRDDFRKLGEDIEYFPGVESWFDRITEYGAKGDLNIEHYVISSGLREIIEGTSIFKKLKEVFACEFFYDEHYGNPIWPALSVNSTAKTQFLFRINKGVLDITDNKGLNEYTPSHERRIPFKKMIYIGDGLTDVPCMRLVRENGGHSIAVYQDGKKSEVDSLLKNGRVDFLSLADYSENGELDTLIKMIIDRIGIAHELASKHYNQLNEIE